MPFQSDKSLYYGVTRKKQGVSIKTKTTIKRLARKILSAMHLRPKAAPPFLRVLHPFHPSEVVHRQLSPSLRERVRWIASDGLNTVEDKDNELFAMFSAVAGVHKWRHYFPVYTELLSPLRESPIKLLEIGVARGGSLKLWQQFLHPKSTIVGIDLDPDCHQFENLAKNVHVRIGSQTDPKFLNQLIAEFGQFHVILDDGSHIPSHMVASFNILFENGLSPGGCYIVEDILTNYWTDYRDFPVSFVDFTKHLVDLMHAHYWSAQSADEFKEGVKREFTVPRITKLLRRIDIHDSIFVFHKQSTTREVPYHIHT